MLALTPPRNVKELCRFLVMVQYHRDLWATYLPLSPHWLESVVRLKSPNPKGPEKFLGIRLKFIKKNSMM
jgi:hypothetical protein